MNLIFHKYEGAGNDFIILDNRSGTLDLDTQAIANLCNRRFGVGADGLMILQHCPGAAFEMLYFNSDGQLGSFCGNGGRCIADYAFRILNITGTDMRFKASDGMHAAQIKDNGRVTLEMKNVGHIQFENGHLLMDTGSPHYLKYVTGLETYPVTEEGRKIRNQDAFLPRGINVNFLENKPEGLFVRTYERGVEAETFACGTGVTAAAIASAGSKTGSFTIMVFTKARHLFEVSFKKALPGQASDITLTGPVNMVFEGRINTTAIQPLTLTL